MDSIAAAERTALRIWLFCERDETQWRKCAVAGHEETPNLETILDARPSLLDCAYVQRLRLLPRSWAKGG